MKNNEPRSVWHPCWQRVSSWLLCWRWSSLTCSVTTTDTRLTCDTPLVSPSTREYTTSVCNQANQENSALHPSRVAKSSKVKVKFSHTRYWALNLELIPVYRQSARRWLCRPPGGRLPLLLPGLWLPSQLKIVTAHWLVPNYTAWWQRHMGVNNLPKVANWQHGGQGSNSRPLSHQSVTP